MTETPSPPPPPKKPGVVPDAQWICYFAIGFTGYLFVARPTQNAAQLIFRLSLLLGGVIGLLILWLRKKKTGR
ncbi:MAG TPA: hypothetical protein VK815_11330 [Candidatus Acidoferrales bacterium]|jgi:hypothetical protein|nr:hypothetical protein [Candidatus Acidoferrales bacterium]